MPSRDRQRRRRRALELDGRTLPAALAEMRSALFARAYAGELTYERTCSRCGQPTFGVLAGGFSSMVLNDAQRARAPEILPTFGTYVCHDCDPAANQQWILSLMEELAS